MTEPIEIPLEEIVFREDLYPRISKSAQTVQKYAEDLSILPPIEINQNKELIDGWHRWTAHKKNEVGNISALVTKTDNDNHFLELAIERNAKFGLQLSQEDKRDMARRIYVSTPEKERKDKKKRLASVLSVNEKTISRWLSRIDKDAKEARNKRILKSWMRCYTQQEIADSEDMPQKTVANYFSQNGQLSKMARTQQANANHATDFEVPIYNVWKWQQRAAQSNHFGNSDVRIVDRLLYLYTKPFDVVVDPFAGGGSTLDICEKRWRRCWISDRKPIVERLEDIREHDITNGLPPIPKQTWKDIGLVYLDPPYWVQAKGQYSNDSDDLANMDLEEFNKHLKGLIDGFSKKMSGGGYIAIIIQPTQWNAPGRVVVDHVADLISSIELPIETRIQAPYESQQCNAQMVNWAKENKKLLVLSREIIVWRVPCETL